MLITSYHAKYFAYELTHRRRGGDIDRISQSLFDASVDLNPHQIDAALFALQNPLNKGVILADEVGLGKTIEAGLVMAQYWAERQRRIIVVCPAILRKQWAGELEEKFNLPCQVLDARTWNVQRKAGVVEPFDQDVITIISYNFAARMAENLRLIPWDLVVIDEAHRLRNAHRESHRTGQAIKTAFGSQKKLLLTATPLQNSLLELYGLSTIIDEQLFGDINSFRRQYMHDDSNLLALKERVQEFTKRTLRRHVNEYIRYTERRAVTIPFTPYEEEIRLYHLISAYIQRIDSYGIPHQQRHLITLVARKLLASSTPAIIRTLEGIIARLTKLGKAEQDDSSWLEDFIANDDLEEEWFIDAANEETEHKKEDDTVDIEKLNAEIIELEQYLELAKRIKVDAKAEALLTAIEQGFESMARIGAERKAVIFTESRRTQDYLLRFLESRGYLGKVITFSGSNTTAAINAIYQRWLTEHQGTAKVTGSPGIDKRSAIIDYFRSDAEILIATEAASEGVNLQFCSLLINYDLPWNPQRIEQRIGRCHRYGQKHDVVVINFLNKKNEADQRVLELLSDKFHLFNGIFGASDEVLGRIESGVDFEKRIATIYQSCRSEKEIQEAFDALQKELEASINQRMDQTREKLLEHFDEQIHELLKVQHEQAELQLDRMQRMFWWLTQHQLQDCATFNNENLSFTLHNSPLSKLPSGDYVLIQKGKEKTDHQHLYRLSHPLGEYVLDKARRLITPVAQINFDLSGHSTKISALANAKHTQGWLELNQLSLQSFANEEYLIFTALSDTGEVIDSEFIELLFRLNAYVATESPAIETALEDKLSDTVKRQIQTALNKALDENNAYFQRERAKLDAWAEDMMLAAEQELEDVRTQIKQARKASRLAESLEEQKAAEENLKKLNRLQRRKREKIFDVQDEIDDKRDAMIKALDAKMHQQSSTQHLFRIRWQLV